MLLQDYVRKVPVIMRDKPQHNYYKPQGLLTSVTWLQLLPKQTNTGIARSKGDGTRAGTRFDLSAKRTGPFKLAGTSVQSTTGSRGVRISGSNGSNAGYTMFWGRVQDYWLPAPLACFPFTSPPVRHRVPSGSERAVPPQIWLLKHDVLCAHEFAHSLDLWHQPRLPKITCFWSWKLCVINTAMYLHSRKWFLYESLISNDSVYMHCSYYCSHLYIC